MITKNLSRLDQVSLGESFHKSQCAVVALPSCMECGLHVPNPREELDGRWFQTPIDSGARSAILFYGK
jgi:hypothetical protein